VWYGLRIAGLAAAIESRQGEEEGRAT
jgi:hypothetical protein